MTRELYGSVRQNLRPSSLIVKLKENCTRSRVEARRDESGLSWSGRVESSRVESSRVGSSREGFR